MVCQKTSLFTFFERWGRLVWWMLFSILILAFLQPFHGGAYSSFLEDYVLASWLVFLFGALILFRGRIYVGAGVWVWLLFGGVLLLSFFTQSVPFKGPINQYFACWLIGFAVMQHAAIYSKFICWSERSLALALAILGVLSSLLGIIKFYDVGGVFFSLLPEPASGRMTGLQGQSNFFAVLCLLGCMGVIWLNRLSVLTGWVGWVICLPLLYSITLAGTRIVYLAFVVWVFVLFFLKGDKKGVGLALFVGLSFWVLKPFFLAVDSVLTRTLVEAGFMPWGGVNDDLMRRGLDSLRWIEWPIAWRIMCDAWPVGVGAGGYAARSYFENFQAGNFPLTGIWLHSHNSYLQIVLEFGAAGAAWLVLAAWLLFRAMVRFYLAGRGLYLGVLCTLLIYSFFEFPLWTLHFFVLFLWVCFSGCHWREVEVRRAYGVLLLPLAVFIFVHYVSLYFYVFKAYMRDAWPGEVVSYSYVNSMIKDPLLEHYGYRQYLESPTYSISGLPKDLELSGRYYSFMPYSSIVSRYIISAAASGDVLLAKNLIHRLSINDPLYREEFLSDVKAAMRIVPSWDIGWLVDEWKVR